ncbi:MAG: hypothetical protein ACI9R3_006085 [Verrucomicrobiales bacterium]|jgi:hypothetical protein
MKKVLALLISVTGLAATASAGTFYYDDPSGKMPIAPPQEMSEMPTASTCASDYFDYDFIDLEWNYTSFEDDSLDEANGISVGLSKTLTEFTFVTLGGLWEPVDGEDGDDIDFWSFSAGAGMVFPLSDRVHLVAEGGVFYGFENGGEDDDGSFGGYAGPTLRVGITRAIEGFASANYIVDEETDQFEYSAGAILRITQSIGLKAGWSWNDDEQTVGVGVRLAF